MVFKKKAEAAPVPGKATMSPPASVAAPVPPAPVSDPMLRVVPKAVEELERARDFFIAQDNKPVQRQSDMLAEVKAKLRAACLVPAAATLKKYLEVEKLYSQVLNELSGVSHEAITQTFLGQRIREMRGYIQQAIRQLRDVPSTIQSLSADDVKRKDVAVLAKKILGPYDLFLEEGHLQEKLDVLVRDVTLAMRKGAAPQHGPTPIEMDGPGDRRASSVFSHAMSDLDGAA